MNRDVLDQWCERAILAVALALLVLMPLAFGGAGQPAVGSRLDFLWRDPFVLAEGLTVLLGGLWLSRLWLKPRPRLFWPPICWAVLAFTGYAVVRYWQADIEYVARQEFLRVLVYAVVFFTILNNLHRQDATQVMSLTLIFLAMAIASYAVYQYVTGSDAVWWLRKPYPHRGTGTYICPNHLGGFLELLLPLALALALTGRLKPVTRILIGYAALVILAGLAATVSRGAWLSTVVALCLFFGLLMFQRNYRLPALVVLVVLVGGGALFLPRSEIIQLRVKQLAPQAGQIDDDARFALWRPAWRLWQEHFWWGSGPGHFNYRFGQYRPERIQMSPERAHNDYLNTLADWGLTGTLLVAAAWGLLGWGVVQTWRCFRSGSAELGRNHGSNKFAFVLGASLGLVAILVHSLLDFNMQVPANALLAVTLMAMLSGHLRFATERYWLGLNRWASLLASLGLLLALGYLGWQAVRHGREQVWLARAEGAQEASPEQIEALNQAVTIEPNNPQTAYALGEDFRKQSLAGGDDYKELAQKALSWLQRSAQLNPWDGNTALARGMCLDWLERFDEAETCFRRAEALEPNSYFVMAGIGWHYVNLGDFAAAKPWLERSLRLEWRDNPSAQSYLQVVNSRLLTAATNPVALPLMLPPR